MREILVKYALKKYNALKERERKGGRERRRERIVQTCNICRTRGAREIWFDEPTLMGERTNDPIKMIRNAIRNINLIS